jgi:hypothetical protein
LLPPSYTISWDTTGFGEAMTNRGFERTKDGRGVRGHAGIRLRERFIK